LVDLLERMLGVSPDWTPEQTVSSLEALLSQYGFNLPEVMPLFLGLLSVKGGSERYPPLGVAPQRAKELTLDALTSLFFEMAQQQQPVLLLVEDLHWADPTTLELLAPLVKDVSSARICLVLTARPEFSVPWTTSYHLQLSRLDRQGMEQMVRGLTQDKPLPPELVEKLLERTDGVPLFVEELTRVVTESMPSGQDTSSRQLSHSQLSIPSTLRDSLMARLDRLGSARELAQLASALGREFSFEVLKAISQREEADFQRELKVLVDADLVHRRRGVRSPTYLFKHALIRDTAYESMLKPLRRQVHARIAATLEAHFPELVQTRPDLLATHHAAAEQKRQALGYVQQAAMSALMRSANQEAVAYITEALGWLEVIEDERERAQLELGLNGILTPAMMVTRGWADARIKALVERSQQLLELLGDLPQTVPTLWTLWLFHHTRGQHEPAWSCAERLLAMAERAGDSGLKVMAFTALGNTAVSEGKLAQTQAYFEQVLALYDPTEHAKLALLFGLDARGVASMCLSLVKFLQGYWDQAVAMIQASHRWAGESKHLLTQALAHLYHLTLLHGRGEREQLIKLADEALETASRYGLATQAMYYNAFRCWATRDAEGLRRWLAIPEGIGQDIGRTYYRAMLVELELDAGRHDAALLMVAELIAWGEANGETYMMCNMLRLKALALRGRGEHQSAEAELSQAIEIARTQGARMLELKVLIDLAELLKERGRLAEVRQRLALFVQSFAEGTDMPDIIRARALIGALPA
jgi:TOMM system kinase/cyclase fusion protein